MPTIYQVINQTVIFWSHFPPSASGDLIFLKKKPVKSIAGKRRIEFNLGVMEKWRDAYQREKDLSACFLYLATHSENERSQAIFYDLLQLITSGESLYGALSALPIGLSVSHGQLLCEAEKSNQLELVIELICSDLRASLSRRKSVEKKMRYPLFLFFMMLVFIHFIILSILPELLSLYQSMAKPANPWVVSLSGNTMLLSLCDAALILILLGRKIPISKKIRLFSQRYFMRIPLVSYVYRKNILLNWLSVFCLCMGSKATIADAWESANQQLNDTIFSEQFNDALDKIKSGETLSAALSLCGCVSIKWRAAFRASEKQSRLLAGSEQLLKTESAELLEILDSILTWFEPIMLLIMAGCVLGLILLLYLPILSSYSGHLA